MKIAQVCPRYAPFFGGVETNVQEVGKRLSKRGFEVFVLTTDPSGELAKNEIINGISVQRFRSWAPAEAYYFSREMRDYLLNNSERFDIVHAHSYHAFPSLYAAQGKSKNKLIFTPHYHGTGHTLVRKLLHIPYKFIGKKTFEKADRIVCVSRYESELLSKRFNFEEEKLTVIPNGVNLDEFEGLKKQRKNHRTILYVGRLEKYKGVQYIIEALPRMSRDMTLQIVGKGPYRENLAKLAQRLNVEERVLFFQDLSRNELLQKYANADVFVLLSEHEAYGISVAEALCAKTPCIVANTSALAEWIDNENCFGIDYPQDPEGLATAVDNAMGKEANPKNVLDWNQVTDKIVSLYESC